MNEWQLARELSRSTRSDDKERNSEINMAWVTVGAWNGRTNQVEQCIRQVALCISTDRVLLQTLFLCTILKLQYLLIYWLMIYFLLWITCVHVAILTKGGSASRNMDTFYVDITLLYFNFTTFTSPLSTIKRVLNVKRGFSRVAFRSSACGFSAWSLMPKFWTGK